VQTDGAVTSVSYGGTGPAVLLLHGFPETNLIWRESPRTLGNNVNRTIGKPCSGNRARIERGRGTAPPAYPLPRTIQSRRVAGISAATTEAAARAVSG
jgi:hypothetical protein